MDANLKDLFLVGRLIGDAVNGAVVVGVSGPLTITILPKFTVTLAGYFSGMVGLFQCFFMFFLSQ